MSLFACGCANNVIETLDKDAAINERFDGAFLDYFFARAEITATASFDKDTQSLSISLSQDIKALPDFEHRHTLSYSHAALSSDEIDIQLDNGLLKKVSSTTSDQTVAVVQGINALLTQASALDAALKTTTTVKKGDEARPIICDSNMKVNATKDINYGTLRLVEEKGSKNCKINLTISANQNATLNAMGYPKSNVDTPSENICDHAVCFRLSGGYTIVANAEITDKNGNIISGNTIKSVSTKAYVVAPITDRVGFVRFERRRFVSNSTTLTFSNGVLTGFSAKDPSELVGFLTLPTELLKGVTLAVKL